METLAYVKMYLEEEREWEGDSSPLPETLEEILNELCQWFVELAQEEAEELVAAGTGEKAMTTEELKKKLGEGAEELKKKLADEAKALAKGDSAACLKAAIDHHAQMAAHTSQMAEMHKAHAAHLDNLHKALTGGIEGGSGGAGPAAQGLPGGTQGAYPGEPAKAAGVTREDLQKMMDDRDTSMLKAIFALLSGGEIGPEPAPGIGDRTMVVSKAHETHPVTKADDAKPPEARTAVPPTPEEIKRAFNGDPEAMLKLARSIKPGGDVPVHLQGVVGKLAR
jgi:hypothetical protein